jgi:uncharacterized protein (TIGR02611 family)
MVSRLDQPRALSGGNGFERDEQGDCAEHAHQEGGDDAPGHAFGGHGRSLGQAHSVCLGELPTVPLMTQARAAARGLTDRARALRGRVRRQRGGRLVWRVAVTVLGVAVTALGIVLLPLPGPGWLIIFAGLGLLATEYAWAARILRTAREQVRRWTEWAKRQSLLVRALLALAGLVVLAGALVLVWLISVA